MKFAKLSGVTLVLLLLVAITPCAAQPPGGKILERASAAFVASAKEVLPGVVLIRTSKKRDAETGRRGVSPEDLSRLLEDESAQAFLEALRESRRSAGTGSGFLVSREGHVVTASYVVDDADEINVRLHDGREMEARLLGADPMSQVAVLKIEGEDLPVLNLGDSSKVEVGQWVMSAGHPHGLRAAVSFGIVGATGVSGVGTGAFEDYIQTDAAMHPGCSGGPLVNVRGQVVGMNAAVISRRGGFAGVGLAVPVNMVKAVKDQIIASGRVAYSYLGVMIHEVDRRAAESLGLDEPRGVLVAGVAEGSPAEKAGLAKRDVVLEMDGKPVEGTASLRKTVALTPPGTRVTLAILREGKRQEVEATLGAHPGSAPEE